MGSLREARSDRVALAVEREWAAAFSSMPVHSPPPGCCSAITRRRAAGTPWHRLRMAAAVLGETPFPTAQSAAAAAIFSAAPGLGCWESLRTTGGTEAAAEVVEQIRTGSFRVATAASARAVGSLTAMADSVAAEPARTAVVGSPPPTRVAAEQEWAGPSSFGPEL